VTVAAGADTVGTVVLAVVVAASRWCAAVLAVVPELAAVAAITPVAAAAAAAVPSVSRLTRRAAALRLSIAWRWRCDSSISCKTVPGEHEERMSRSLGSAVN
jgi:hypothetical protein